MSSVFIAPKSEEESYKKLLEMINNGILYKDIEKYLTPENKKILGLKEKFYGCGLRRTLIDYYNMININDKIIFYRKKDLVFYGKIIAKQYIPEIPDIYGWPIRHNMKRSYVYFFDNIKPINISVYVFNEFNYNIMPLTHFSNINNEVMDKINERYGSFDSFIDVKNKYIHFF